MLFPRSRFLFLFVAVVGLGTSSCRTPSATANPPITPPANETSGESLGALGYAGSQAALATLDQELATAGRDTAQLNAITERLAALLNHPDTSFAARQAIAQRLGVILAGPIDSKVAVSARAALAAMLEHDLQIDLARLALEPVPGEPIDALFLDALKKSSGRKRLAIIQSLATRRVAAAIPLLAALQSDSDRPLALAATKAISEIGGTAAIAALRSTPERNASERAAAVLAAARTLPADQAASVYQAILSDEEVPGHLRAFATRSLLTASPNTASQRILEILVGSDWELKQVALEAVAGLPPAEIVPALATRLSTFDASTQIAVIAAFRQHPHPSAVPAVSTATAHADPEVRAAAIAALGSLPGDAGIAKLLAEKIASDTATARLARPSLARLNGPAVAATVLTGASQGETAMRVIFIEQLALRYMTEALPQLLAMRSDADQSIRVAAAAAIGELGGASEQTALLDWAIAATDPAEQSRALRAFITLTLRLPNADTRGAPLFAALEQAPPEICLRLLPALPRLGGAASAACAARLAMRNDSVVAEAATTTLARWPDRKGLLPLLDVAEKASAPERRKTAENTALQWLERNRESWSSELTTIASRLAATASDDQTRRRLLVILRRGNDNDALALAEKFRAQPALAAEAQETALTIRANLAGTPTFRASNNTGNLRYLVDNRPNTFWRVTADAEQWLEIDFKNPRPLHQITLNQTDRPEDFPERYELFVTDQLDAPGSPRVSGTGQHGKTNIDLPPGTVGRYIIIKHTAERKDSSWSIGELFVD